jgi:hypothetical protein
LFTAFASNSENRPRVSFTAWRSDTSVPPKSNFTRRSTLTITSIGTWNCLAYDNIAV